jgi:ribokinase
MRLTPADVEAAEPLITNSDILVLQLENPLETVVRAAEIAAARGITIVLNPAPAREVPDGLLALVGVLVPNEVEAAMLTGLAVRDGDDAVIAAHMLAGRGPRAVVTTRGAKGAVLLAEGSVELVPACEVSCVDATAAGDAFIGGLTVALAEGRPLPEAVRWANAAGALATTVHGAMPSLPMRHAVEEMLRRRGRGTSRQKVNW